MALLYGPQNIAGAAGTSAIELYSGQAWTIAPAGPYQIFPSRYHQIQVYDPIMQIWAPYGGWNPTGGSTLINSDGVNFRLFNPTGLPAGALINNAGTAYTSTPTVTVSGTGGSKWRAIVGGAVSATVTVTAAGTNYTYAPIVVIAPPPLGGIPATGYSTLSGSTVGSVTITNQGAGYLFPPSITFLNDPREINNPALTTGYGAVATTALTGAATITGILCTDPGGVAGPLTAIPTLTISGGGGSAATAIVIMCWTITGYTVTTGGNLGSGSGSVALVTALDNFPTSAPAYTNTKTQSNMVITRFANIWAPITSNQPTTPPVVYDGGIYTSSPALIVLPTATVVTTAPVLAPTLGGSAGTSWVYSSG